MTPASGRCLMQRSTKSAYAHHCQDPPGRHAGRKRGYLTELPAARAQRVMVLSTPVHAPDLIQPAVCVYTVSSQIGFEALLWGIPVRTFGMPFYAGWGHTIDALPPPSRRTPMPLLQLIHAALIRYVRYVDPETGQRCEVERIVEHLALQRRQRARFPERVHAVGFSRWKRPIARSFFQGSTLTFGRQRGAVPADAQAVAVWGRKVAANGTELRPVIRVEDGFLRSVGLGAALTPPISWVQDPVGIYYDAHAASGIEQLLLGADFPGEALARARTLRQRIVARDISKYNLPQYRPWRRPSCDSRVLLVIGQVESDASLHYGTLPDAAVRTNRELIEAVRLSNPDAYLLFRAHPDVAMGYRRASAMDTATAALIDEVVSDVSLADLWKGIDEVHVITSLTGFEALLRGIAVTAYGIPFYAGWGLTRDRTPIDRPRCQRSLMNWSRRPWFSIRLIFVR